MFNPKDDQAMVLIPRLLKGLLVELIASRYTSQLVFVPGARVFVYVGPGVGVVVVVVAGLVKIVEAVVSSQPE